MKTRQAVHEFCLKIDLICPDFSSAASLLPVSPPEKKDPFLVAFGIYGAVGFQLATAVVGGLLLGGWLDKRWGTSPWLTLGGLLIGAIGGFYNLIRLLNWKEARTNKND